MNRLDLIIDVIKNSYREREIVLWGAGSRGVLLKQEIEARIKNVKYVVDVDESKQNNSTIFAPSVLEGKSDEIFVVVTCAAYFEEIEQELQSYGYNQQCDYCYCPNEVKGFSGNSYSDMFGNKIVGNPSGAIVRFAGKNSTLVIGEGCNIKNSTFILADSCKVEIGEGAAVNPRGMNVVTEWKLGTAARLRVGKNCIFYGGGHLFICKDSGMEMGEGTTVGYDYIMWSPANSVLTIGKDCMFSARVGIVSQDGHAIFDLKTGEQVNYHKGTTIGDHVWIGYNATVLKNLTIGSGSIVGANSHVNKSVPNNCVVSGVPAVIVRKNVAWTREVGEEQLDMLDIEYKKYTEDKDD